MCAISTAWRLRLSLQLSTHFTNLHQRQCVVFTTLNSLYIMFRTGNVVRYLMLYAPAPSSWPMPDRLASKSWASPDSITSSVRGNFRAHAMATITGSDGVGPRLNPHFNLFSQIVVSLSGGGNMTRKQCYHRISPALYGGNLCKRHYNDKG